MKTITVTIHTMMCGTCGHIVTALREESMRAAMLDHLICVHSGAPV